MKDRLPYIVFLACLGLLISCQSGSVGSDGSPLEFAISFTEDAHTGPMTGRVYVMLAKNDQREPRFQVRRARGRCIRRCRSRCSGLTGYMGI